MKKHTIDIVFSLSLFMMFVLCSFFLILFQINGFKNLQYNADNVYTISSYLQTTIRQSDRLHAIEIKNIQERECLVIQHVEGVSYLYIKDDYLMELYQDASMDVNFNLGNKRFQLADWKLSKEDDILHISLQKEDQTTTLSLQIKSGGVAL